MHIAIDEWNSWWGKTEPMRKPERRETAAGGRGGGGPRGGGVPDGASSSEWSVGRELLEEVYGMEDALLVGGTLNSDPPLTSRAPA